MTFTATALRMASPVIVWGLHFGAIYGTTALACARGAPQVALVAVASATLIAAALMLAIIGLNWPRREQFESWFAAAIAAFALVGVVWEALPALWVPTCG